MVSAAGSGTPSNRAEAYHACRMSHPVQDETWTVLDALLACLPFDTSCVPAASAVYVSDGRSGQIAPSAVTYNPPLFRMQAEQTGLAATGHVHSVHHPDLSGLDHQISWILHRSVRPGLQSNAVKPPRQSQWLDAPATACTSDDPVQKSASCI